MKLNIEKFEAILKKKIGKNVLMPEKKVEENIIDFNFKYIDLPCLGNVYIVSYMHPSTSHVFKSLNLIGCHGLIVIKG